MTVAKVLEQIRGPLLADGKIDFGETSVISRTIRPFVLNGDADAVLLQRLLDRFRADGVIDPDESRQLVEALEHLASRQPRLAEYVRAIPDFPKPGVLFRDVTGILDTAEGFTLALNEMSEKLDGCEFDVVAAPESRGFIFGSALAARFGKAFVPIRKPGKLPRVTIHEDYDLEYGKATLHMHADAIISGERVVIVDDLLATGGTAAAAARLVERLGGIVAKMLFPLELEGFSARTGLLAKYDVSSLVRYPGR